MNRERVLQQPIIVVALSLVLGVVLGAHIDVGVYMLVAIFAILLIANLFVRSSIVTFVAVVVAGATIYGIDSLGSQSDGVDTASRSTIIERLSDKAVERIHRLDLEPDSQSLVDAILLGQRGGMSRELVHAYRSSGASHLLAISGLHVGMVVLFVSLLLRPIVLLPFGNIALDLLLIILLWLYAAVVGLSPSVVRATIMFSVLVLTRLTTGSYSPLRSLAIAVIAMVAFDPSIIFAVGFQLSVVSVVAIIVWVLPLSRGLHRAFSTWRGGAVIEFLVMTLLIGVACSVATMPLVSLYFGSVVLWGAVLNPIVIITTYLIVVISLIWLLIGFGLVLPLFSGVVNWLCAVQNGLLVWCSENWSSPVALHFDVWSTLIIYAMYICVTMIAYHCRSLYAARRDSDDCNS